MGTNSFILRAGMFIVSSSLLLLIGCTPRSISNSGYPGTALHGPSYIGSGHSGFAYRGELSEFAVLGVKHDEPITEESIIEALDSAGPVEVPRGASVMLIQSGAAYPDEPMLHEFQKFYRVTPFSGIPDHSRTNDYSRALRYAAARAGNSAIICYWGVLETAQKDLATKTVSWVPLVGWTVPDEKQQMRIRLKMAVIDVRTGRWRMYTPQSYEDMATSNIFTRKNSDQRQVQLLKEKAYVAAAQDLIKTMAH